MNRFIRFFLFILVNFVHFSKTKIPYFTRLLPFVSGLYFSAHWCPPCRGFTPVLAEYYNEWQASNPGKKLEIVFLSSDRDQGSFDEYFKEMPWAALDFSKSETKVNELSTDLKRNWSWYPSTLIKFRTILMLKVVTLVILDSWSTSALSDIQALFITKTCPCNEDSEIQRFFQLKTKIKVSLEKY